MSSKLREAAENVARHHCFSCPNNWTGECELPTSEGESKYLCHKVKQLRSALAEPLRNCDVGTAEEQAERFDAYCDSHTNCAHCPLAGRQQCVLAWSQMPYKEEVK